MTFDMDHFEFRTGVIRPVECYKEAWEMIKDQYWLVFAIVLVGMIIGSLVPIIILGPMMCGIYLCLLDKVEGREISFDRLFKGFDHFIPSFILTIIIMAPVVVMVILIYVPLIAMAMAGPRMNESEMLSFFAGVIIFEVIVAVIMVCIHTLLLFSYPLIADKRVSAWQSIKLSSKAVWANLSGVAGLFGVAMILVIIGYLMLCIGIYLVIPIIFAANAVAYRKIFPRGSDPSAMPPSPNFYKGI